MIKLIGFSLGGLLTLLPLYSCDQLKSLHKQVEDYIPSDNKALTDGEITSGLKQALEVGTENAVKTLNKTDGYFGNSLTKIAFPPDAVRAADKLRQLGMGKQVDDFVLSMNRAAEDAAAAAAPIFVDAIKEMSIDDARKILTGPNDAATNYFREKTSAALYQSFSPQVTQSLEKVQVTKHWSNITGTYNKIPFVNKVNTDLPDYVTNKALDGLFLTLKQEEAKIRQNPAARVTDLLQKVFGSQDK